MADTAKASGVPTIELTVERIMKNTMRKAIGKYNMMNICKLIDFELHKVRSVFDSVHSYLLNKGDTKPIILDTGFSISINGFRYSFVEGTPVKLFHTHLMDNICA